MSTARWRSKCNHRTTRELILRSLESARLVGQLVQHAAGHGGGVGAQQVLLALRQLPAVAVARRPVAAHLVHSLQRKVRLGPGLSILVLLAKGRTAQHHVSPAVGRRQCPNASARVSRAAKPRRRPFLRVIKAIYCAYERNPEPHRPPPARAAGSLSARGPRAWPRAW